MNNEGEKLCNRFCSFIYEDFSKQVEYNREKTKEYFRRIRNTGLLQAFDAKDAEDIKQVPVTTYDNYFFLKEFGKKVKKLESEIPRGEK